MKRTSLVEARDHRYDVIIIGGGILGTAIARDASMRGYRTLLLEKEDFGSGSTSRTSRLLIGAPLFLEGRDLKLLGQMERERRIQQILAPHLVRPIPSVFVAPETAPGPSWKRRLVGTLQSMLHPEADISRLRATSGRKLPSLCGFSPGQEFRVGYQGSDGLVTQPERLCLENLLSSQLNGAHAANYARVVSVQVHNRRVQGVTAEDRITGKSSRLDAACVINATGPWIDQICTLADDRYISRLRLRRETYLVLPRPAAAAATAMVFPNEQGNRALELVPWHDYLMLGPAVSDVSGDPDDCGKNLEDVDRLLAEARRLFSDSTLDRQSIVCACSGLRVLASDTGRSLDMRASRPVVVDHGKAGGPKGLISVAGGRLAGYRHVAQQAVDSIRSHVGEARASQCQTHAEQLYGGNIPNLNVFMDEVSNAARNYALSDPQVRHLVSLYGTKSQEIFQWLKGSDEMRLPICPHQPDIRAQLLYAVEREMAVTVGDIFLRRTAIGLGKCRGLDCVRTAAETLARHLNWSEARVQVEIHNYAQEIEQTYWRP